MAKKIGNNAKKEDSNFKKAVTELLGTPEPERVVVEKEVIKEVKREVPGEKDLAYIPQDMVIAGNVCAASDIKIAGKVEGDVVCEGNIELSGMVHGNLKAKNLKITKGSLEGEVAVEENIVVEETSTMKGNLSAKNVSSNGKIEGQIVAGESVELKGNAYVKGDVAAKTFSVSAGAHINGKVCTNE